MKLLLTGGHLTPALAMIDWLKLYHPEVKLVFVGRTHSQVNQPALEKFEIAKRQIPFLILSTPKFALIPWWQLPGRWLALIVSTWQACWLLWQERPTAVLTFGGYLAVPVVLAAWLQRIPIVTHEQTRTVGLANRWIGKFATKVGVAFEVSLKYFPAQKTRVVGNPLRSSLFDSNLKPPTWFQNPHHKPILVITGGSQGSQAINQCVDQIIAPLTQDWGVIHQRGTQAAAEPSQPGRYYAREWLSDTELFWFWRQPTTLGVSRAGANTVTELVVVQVPAVLIPLPFAYQDEQKLNALWLVEAGGAILLEQAQLSPQALLKAIQQLQTQQLTFRQALGQLSVPTKALEGIWQLLQAALQAS